jgi:PAS domain S-box-containing protein
MTERQASSEEASVQALQSYDVLDTPPEGVFDGLAALAAHLLQTPMAMVSLVDGKRQWSKSHHGLAAQEMPREVAMCAYAIRSTERVFEVPDAKADQRFASSALVAGAAQVRFYAGAPLVNVEGYALGTLCVMDHRPGQLDHQGRYVLAALAEQVVAQLELRRTSDHLQRRLSEESTLKERLQEEFDAALESERTVRDQLDAQRQFMQQVMDVLPSVVYVYDCQARRNVFVNPEVVNALGHAPSAVQAVDDPIKAYMHPDDAVRFVDHLQELFKLEQMQVAEISYRMRHADGSWRWFHSREAVLKQADGGPGCQIVGSATDITASKTAAEAMRASEERFRALAELSTVGIGGTDDRGLVLYVNARAAEIIGLPAAECLGKGWTQTLHPGDRPRMMAGWAAALTARQPFCAEFRFQHADGTVVHVLGETRPLPTYRQCETSAVVTLVDLTTVRELELSRRAQEVAEQASKAKNNFVARMSHEMRTPLNGILGFAQLLQVGSVEPSSPRQAQYAGYIEQAGRHLLALIDETLDLARIECGGITLTLQPVPLHQGVPHPGRGAGPQRGCDDRAAGTGRRRVGICGPSANEGGPAQPADERDQVQPPGGSCHRDIGRVRPTRLDQRGGHRSGTHPGPGPAVVRAIQPPGRGTKQGARVRPGFGHHQSAHRSHGRPHRRSERTRQRHDVSLGLAQRHHDHARLAACQASG